MKMISSDNQGFCYLEKEDMTVAEMLKGCFNERGWKTIWGWWKSVNKSLEDRVQVIFQAMVRNSLAEAEFAAKSNKK